MIDSDTRLREFKNELRWNDMYFALAHGSVMHRTRAGKVAPHRHTGHEDAMRIFVSCVPVW